MTTAARLADWFLTAAERGNPATRLDARRGDGLAWSTGNLVRPATTSRGCRRGHGPEHRFSTGFRYDPDGRPPALRRAGTF